MKKTLIIATRKSPLALWQAHWVKNQLHKIHPHLTIELLGLTTTADQITSPLYQVGGKGLFVKELEEALLDKRADIAVHSLKDVPMELPSGLALPVICQREDPRDAFISPRFSSFNKLPLRARVGTSSLRRQGQLLALRPDLKIIPLRGNVSTRLDKLDKGEFDAIILAAAGLKRLELQQRIQSFFATTDMLPAAGQGALGLECREDDFATKKYINPLNHPSTAQCVIAERALCRQLGAGCHVPVAAYAEKKQNQIYLRGMITSPDGQQLLRVDHQNNATNPEKLGILLADTLMQLGAAKLLNNSEIK